MSVTTPNRLLWIAQTVFRWMRSSVGWLERKLGALGEHVYRLAHADDPREVEPDRERQIYQLLAEGKSNKETAAVLGISVKTVEAHRKQLMNKLDIHSVAELTKYAIRQGLTSHIFIPDVMNRSHKLTRARARGAASSALGMVRTGTTGDRIRESRMSIGVLSLRYRFAT